MELILYIGFAQQDEWQNWAGTYARHARRFEEAAGGAPCLIIPFYHVTMALMERLRPSKVLWSGFARSFEQYDISSFLGVTDWIDSHPEIPVLALCGGHQLVGFHFQQPLRSRDRLRDEPIRRLHPGEPVTNPDYHPEFYMERGYYPLQIHLPEDPLFAGLGERPYLFESHYCEIKAVPPGFKLLASTPECPIQAMRHTERPLWGVQFHPEDYSERFPAGRRLLENFLAPSTGSNTDNGSPMTDGGGRR